MRNLDPREIADMSGLELAVLIAALILETNVITGAIVRLTERLEKLEEA